MAEMPTYGYYIVVVSKGKKGRRKDNKIGRLIVFLLT